MFISSLGDDSLAELSNLPTLKNTKELFSHEYNQTSRVEQSRSANAAQIPLSSGEPRKNWNLLRTLSRATMIARHVHVQDKNIPVTDPDGLQALRQAAQRGELQKTRLRWQFQDTTDPYDWQYAAPLSPLKERDNIALMELFQRDDMYEIEVDVSHRLLHLLPEPCWEDNPFEFLIDFL